MHSALPNLGRSQAQAQRSLGTGTFGSGWGYDRVERLEAIARFLYFDEPQGPAALRAGLIEVITDPPLCIMWLGVAYSVRSFVEVFMAHKIVDRVQCFNQVVWIDTSLEYTADEWVAWLKERISYQVAAGRRAYEEKLRQARESREAQARADARNAALRVARARRALEKDHQRHPRTRIAATEHHLQMRHFEFRCVSSVVRKVQPLKEEATMSKTIQRDISRLFDVATSW